MGSDYIVAVPILMGLVISFLNLEINLSKSEFINNPLFILLITSPSIANK